MPPRAFYEAMVFRHERGAHAALHDEAAGMPSAQAQLELIDLRLTLWASELGRGRMPNERLMLGIDALLDQRLVAMERRDAIGAVGCSGTRSTMSDRLPMED